MKMQMRIHPLLPEQPHWWSLPELRQNRRPVKIDVAKKQTGFWDLNTPQTIMHAHTCPYRCTCTRMHHTLCETIHTRTNLNTLPNCPISFFFFPLSLSLVLCLGLHTCMHTHMLWDNTQTHRHPQRSTLSAHTCTHITTPHTHTHTHIVHKISSDQNHTRHLGTSSTLLCKVSVFWTIPEGQRGKSKLKMADYWHKRLTQVMTGN